MNGDKREAKGSTERKGGRKKLAQKPRTPKNERIAPYRRRNKEPCIKTKAQGRGEGGGSQGTKGGMGGERTEIMYLRSGGGQITCAAGFQGMGNQVRAGGGWGIGGLGKRKKTGGRRVRRQSQLQKEENGNFSNILTIKKNSRIDIRKWRGKTGRGKKDFFCVI